MIRYFMILVCSGGPIIDDITEKKKFFMEEYVDIMKQVFIFAKENFECSSSRCVGTVLRITIVHFSSDLFHRV